MADEREGRIVRVVDHGHDTRSLFLRLDGDLAFRPGQFVSCLLPIGGERLIRPYSIASDPESPREIELLLNRVPGGPGSAYLLGLAPGATVRFTGPWGTFVLGAAPPAETVFIAEGTGIAPIRPMIHRALATGGPHALHLLQAAPTPAQAVYAAELAALAARHPRFRREWVATAALEDAVARRWIDADTDRGRHFFICGVGALVLRLRDRLRAAGYERRAVRYEKW